MSDFINTYKNIHNFDLTHTIAMSDSEKEKAIAFFKEGNYHPRMYFKYYVEPLIRWRYISVNGLTHISNIYDDGPEETNRYDIKLEWYHPGGLEYVFDECGLVIDDCREIDDVGEYVGDHRLSVRVHRFLERSPKVSDEDEDGAIRLPIKAYTLRPCRHHANTDYDWELDVLIQYGEWACSDFKCTDIKVCSKI